MKTRINGGWIVAWIDGAHQILEQATMVYEGNRIIFIGSANDPECPNSDTEIDARGKLVSPGLINLHCIANLDLQLLRMDRNDSGKISKPKSFVFNDDVPFILSDQDFKNSAEFSIATLLKGGTTTFATVTSSATKRWEEASPESYALADVSADIGARAWIGHFYREGCEYIDESGVMAMKWDSKEAMKGLDNAIELIKYIRSKSNPRLTGFLFPARTDRCSDDLLKETMRQSKLFGGLHVRTHFSEYLHEYREFKSRNPKRTMVEWLDQIGFLGPNVCLTHVVYIAGHSDTGESPGEDLNILSDSQTSVCHCPLVLAREGVALESFGRYLDAGINMGIGTDTFPPNILEEMRLAALINKIIDGRKDTGTIRDIYNAVTVGGAKALGRDDLGKLAVGCLADISIFDLTGLETGAIDDPMRTLLTAGTGRECDMVIVDGKILVRDGSLVGINESDLMERAQISWLNYKNGIASWDVEQRSIDLIVPQIFPSIAM